MRLDDLVQKNYAQMNASDHRICSISVSIEKTPETVIKPAGRCIEVSHTTVLRFLQLIGIMDGYNDFKAFLKWDSLNQPVFDQHIIEQTSYNLTLSDSG